MGSLVSVVVSDMEDLEDEAIDTTPPDTSFSMWRRYIDDSFKVVR